jgi:hypothetical protein
MPGELGPWQHPAEYGFRVPFCCFFALHTSALAPNPPLTYLLYTQSPG